MRERNTAAAFILAFALLWASPGRALVPKGLEKYDPARIPLVTLVTVGQGPAAFDRFGETALRVRVEEKKSDVFYTYCVFDREGTGTLDILSGKLRYRLLSYPYAAALDHYRRLGREFVEQDLSPTIDGAYALAATLAAPDNPDRAGYTLDLLHSNCTTKVRDLIDTSVHGRLRETWKQLDNQSVREHVLRMSADAVLAYVALDFLLGPAADRHQPKWDAAFLPQMLQRAVEGVKFEGVHGVATLVKASRRTLDGPNAQIRRRAPDRAREIWRGNAVAVAVVLILGSLAFGGGRASRVLFAIVLGSWGAIVGGIGTVSLLLAAFASGTYFGWNLNWLTGGPVALALPLLGLGVYRGEPRWLGLGLWLSVACATGTAVALAVGKVPGVAQENERIVALCLPLWVAFSYSLAKLRYPLFSPAQLWRWALRRWELWRA